MVEESRDTPDTDQQGLTRTNAASRRREEGIPWATGHSSTVPAILFHHAGIRSPGASRKHSLGELILTAFNTSTYLALFRIARNFCRNRFEPLAQNPTQTSSPNTGDAQTGIIGLRGSYLPSKPTTRSCDKRGLPTPTRADPHELTYNTCPFYLA